MSSPKGPGKRPVREPEPVRAEPTGLLAPLAHPRLIGLALALVTLLVYLPVRHHGFIDFDDPEYITENRMVQAGVTGPGLKWALTTTELSLWLPVTRVSHMLDCELFGLDAGAHHLVNALFHAANAALLLGLLFRLTGALWPSALAAALFAWHPLRVESVAWAAERKDVLSTFFFLLTLWAYSRVQSSKSRVPSPESKIQSSKSEVQSSGGLRSDARRYYALTLLCFALGLMAKPMLVTLPFVLLLLDYWPLARFDTSRGAIVPRNLPALIWEKAPFFLLSAVVSAVTVFAAQNEAVSLAHYPFAWRLANALVSYASYLGKAIWPVNLAVLYPLPESWPEPTVALAAALLGGLSWLAWHFRRSRPYLLMGWLWFLGTLLPVSGLVQVGRQAMADRFTYVPLIGVAVAVGFEARYWLRRWQTRPVVAGLASGVVLLACLGATARQLSYWVDSETLFKHTLAVTRDNGIAHLNLGVALEESGRPEEALKEYREAARLEPTFAQVHNNLGNLLSALGRKDEALAQYREGLRLDDKAPLLHANLGTILAQLGQFDEAMREYTEAARLAPNDPRPHYLMAKAWLRQGRPQDAIAQFHEALHLDSNDLQSLIFLARVRAAYPEPSVRDATEAVGLAERANALSEGVRPLVLDTLAMAYAEAGRFAEALQAQRSAIDRATGAGETNAVAEMQPRLRLYQANQPYRDAFTNAPERRL